MFPFLLYSEQVCHTSRTFVLLYLLWSFDWSLVIFGVFVMNIEWDYNYYQPWSDNEWLVDEMLAMLDEDIIIQ